MSTEEIKKKIEKELLSSGFLLELYCENKLLKKGFGVEFAQYFVDEEGVNREIDICANYQDSYKEKAQNTLFSSVIIECKKNKKHPWVFIEDLSGGHLNCYSDSSKVQEELNVYSIDHHYLKKPASKNYNVCFCGPNSRDHRQIYDAVKNVISYYEFSLERIKKLRKSSESNKVGTNIFYLTVVFDGLLFLANAKPKDIKLKEVKHVILNVSQQNKKDNKYHYYSIDIVQKSYFDFFLNGLKKDHKSLKEKINSILSPI